MLNQIVVAGAIVRGCTVLVAQRVRPPELAGRWELP
ncbi:DNA mismatch repair protein MutT, partial [Mycobacterium tuberculosis]|nr:DNA mismatch repair protein MutT [Mycobacterium tuberculosis]